ncbi:DUF4983 domain-containing protein [Sphingobacterium sp. SGG-5]|uniref:alkaline phosphatase family protein n=1 Tax=Sphingobacterium sp. SGG-5 TaxID=2710881 RepID=UPI0013EE1103|nr:alkaline phosphatase family protein [Sphingobacterium sp. SGG-5]NGM62154.1 DUF4983 domain-containing protein [Sphingobacterium sp. SGG-5]
MKTLNYLILLFILVTAFSLNACKQYFDPPLVFEPDPGPNLTKDRKVLLISIDGLAGLELYNYVPANINTLLEHSKYTFEGIADANTHDAAAWTTILSGKNSAKHGVHSNDFDDEAEVDPDDPHGHEGSGESTGYITVYQRLLETGRSLKSLSITPWAPLDQNMFNLSDENGVVESDEAAKDKAVDRIKNGEDNLTFTVVNFRDLNAAGLAGGFSMENADYKTTLDRIDGYIGDILEAVSQRKRSANEDWVIIVTSNHGGINDSYGGSSLEERKVPIIYYNENFVGQQFSVPPFTTAFRARNGVNGTIPAVEAEMYNIGTSGEYTIQLKLMVHQFGSNNPAIISKQSNTGNAVDGWSFIHNTGVGWRIKVRGTQITAANPKFDIDKWYTLTARIYMDGTTRKVQVFTDGTLINEGDLGTAQGSSSNDLNVGYAPAWTGGTTIQTVKDLCIYNTALPAQYIQDTYCQSPIDYGNYEDNLIGYWALGDGIGSKLRNSVQGAPDFTLNGSYSWEFMQNDFCKIATGEEEDENEAFLYSIDILPQIFYWLNIETHDSWDLEGSVFLSKFETEFIGK